jgi:hypothetical protein
LSQERAGDSLEKADPAAQRKAPHARVAEDTASHREAVSLRGRVQFGPGRSAVDARSTRFRIDLHAAHPPQVDDQAAFDDAVPGDAVATASHGEPQFQLTREVDRLGDAGRRRWQRDEAGCRSIIALNKRRVSS